MPTIKMNTHFMIPNNLEELLHDKFDNYVVSNVLSVSDITDWIKESKCSASEIDVYFILEHFDVLFSVVYKMNTIKFEVLHEFFQNVIVESLKCVCTTLEFKCEEDMTSESRIKLINSLKMIVYVYVNFVKLFREKLSKTYELVIDKAGTMNEKLAKHMKRYGFNLEANERVGFEILHQILSYPIYKLWKPEVVDDDFINLVGNHCFAGLENPSITSAKLKYIKDLICAIFITLVKSYSYIIIFKTKVLEMVKNHEHLVGLLSELVVKFVVQLNCKTLVKELFLHILEFSESLFDDTTSQDNVAVRSLANFITEIAEHNVELVLPWVDILTPALDTDPYSIRICTLTVLTEILVRILKTRSLTDELKQFRDEYLGYMMDHLIDTNFYVRCKVIRLWHKLWTNFCIPKQYIIQVVELLIQRLDDKSALVVKFTVQLLQIIVQTNPYGLNLEQTYIKTELTRLRNELSILQTEFKEERTKLEEMWDKLKPDILSFLRQNMEGDDDSWQLSGVIRSRLELPVKFEEMRNCLLENKFEKAYRIATNIDDSFSDIFRERKCLISDRAEYFCWIFHVVWMDDWDLYIKDLADLQAKSLDVLGNKNRVGTNNLNNFITYYEEGLKFAEMFTNAIPSICEIVCTESIYETVECIQFVVMLNKFNVTGVEECIHSILPLVHSKESLIKNGIIVAFNVLFLDRSTNISAIEVIHRLIDLMKILSIEGMLAFKVLINESIKSNYIEADVIQELWNVYTKSVTTIRDEDDQIAALDILTMIASAHPTLPISKLDVLLQNSIKCEKPNYCLISSTCRLMKQMSQIKTELDTCMRVPSDCEMINCLALFIEENFNDFSNVYYVEVTIEIIEAIYAISEDPDVVCEQFIKHLYKLIRPKGAGLRVRMLEEPLARFIIIIGQVAYSQWKYIYADIIKELKCQNALLIAETEDGSVPLESQSRIAYIKEITRNAEIFSKAEKNAEQSISRVCDKELLHDRDSGLLAQLSPLVVNVWMHPDVYPGFYIRSAVSSTMSKFMLISRAFCIQHIEKFTEMMNTCTEEVVKLNMIPAFGDMFCVHPNVMEPYSSVLYSRLRDKSKDVRYVTLLIVSYLSINEMVKIKRQMTDVAFCLIDDDPRIRHLATCLFSEFGNKDNTIYNTMPEVISRLSQPSDDQMSEENFDTIIQTLVSFLKDKHMEPLIEKLSRRLRTTMNERQNRDISYCLTLLTYSDRSVQKLIDYIPSYRKKLSEVGVRTNLITVLTNCKKSTKLNKEYVEKLENKIEAVLNKGSSEAYDEMNNDDKFSEDEDNLTDEVDLLRTPLKTPFKTPRKLKMISEDLTSSSTIKKPITRHCKRENGNITDAGKTARLRKS